MKIEKSKILKNYTTFRIGGKADFFVDAKSIIDVLKAKEFAKSKKIPLVVIGKGSNILIGNKGFRGLVLKINYKDCHTEKNRITCGAGISLAQLLSLARDYNLGGAEFLAGIPGTLGGAVAGNAGTGSKSISQIVESVKILKNNGLIIKAKPSYFNFGYRESKIKKEKDIILEATLSLKKSDKKKIKNKIKNILKKRKNQPKEFSAGSVFKNLKNYYAGELIAKAGLQGESRGKAQISKEHGNFIINLGKAKTEDVKYLIKKIQKKVMNKFGVQLNREIRFLEEKGWR